MTTLPALSVVGSAGKRNSILELAATADERGFAGLAVPWIRTSLGMTGSLAHVTRRIPFFSSIEPIYLSSASVTAAMAFHLAEVSGGRFRLGLGVSHQAMVARLGVTPGSPLSDMREYVAAIRAANRGNEQTPPIYLAALRDKMLLLAAEIADGAIWANASLRHTPVQVATVRARVAEVGRGDDFFLATMVPTVIDADRQACRAIHRRTMAGYVSLPNYRNYWKAAGYEDEMVAIEATLAVGDRDASAAAMSDRWIDDCTISGSQKEVRDRLQQWYDIGVTPIAVMSSTSGGQATAIGELFDLYG